MERKVQVASLGDLSALVVDATVGDFALVAFHLITLLDHRLRD
jgi:hypothetical protein